MEQKEIKKKIDNILEELHRLTIDIIELKRATISLRYQAYNDLTGCEDDVLNATFKKLEKITDTLLGL